MNIQQLLQSAKKDISVLDAEVLLAFVLKKEREYLFMYPKTEVSVIEERKYRDCIERRKKHEPAAYITHSKEFYGRDFYVNTSTLIPRPETEELIDLLKNTVKEKNLLILDIGTGSGCIAATLSLEGYTNVCASDICKKCLKVAQKNFERHKVSIETRYGSLLTPWKDKKIDVLVTNLPYIPENIKLMPDVIQYEPKKALFGGKEGDNLYIQLMQQIKNHPEIRYFFFEIDDSYAENLLESYSEELSSWSWQLKNDLSGKRRFLVRKM